MNEVGGVGMILVHGGQASAWKRTCRGYVEFIRTSISRTQLLSCWLSMDNIWRP